MSFVKYKMSFRKGFMNFDDVMKTMCRSMGMIPHNDPFGCGSYFVGDGKTTNGFFWYLVFEDYFVITKCDYVFCKETHFTMAGGSLYLSLRLDYAGHLPPGKILAFMEEAGAPAGMTMTPGTRVAYTEVTYIPAFYKKHLETAFNGAGAEPLVLLKSMGGEHNWSADMMRVLCDIQKCSLTGLAAELRYVGKGYELMAALVAMGNERLPKKPMDYEDIARVIAYIDENYTHSITQSELVSLSHMSATKLKNLFRQFAGCTITDYIMQRKADRAEHLLADTTLTVEEISRMIGFDTATGFATSFKKMTGLSPSEYRRQIAFQCLRDPSVTKDLKI